MHKGEYNIFAGEGCTVETGAPDQGQGFLKRIIEALLFSSGEPISFDKMKESIEQGYPVTTRQLRTALCELSIEYRREGRAFDLEEIAHGFVLRTRAAYSPFVEALLRDRRQEKLSPAALEVLAIVAFRQPITRPQMEALRGVDCSGVIQTLLERGLLTTRGRLEAPGRPSLYVTTKAFLQHFGLKDADALPAAPSDNNP